MGRMKTTIAFPFLAATFLFGCSNTMTARVSTAEGLAPGAPVTLAGVPYGTVENVEVAGGNPPVVVRFKVDGNAEAVAQGACARVRAGTVELSTEDAQPVVEGQIAECPRNLLEDLAEGMQDLTQDAVRQLEGIGNAGDLGRRAGEEARRAAEGFAEGAGLGTRDTARQMGEQLREAATGLREGIGPDGVRDLGRAVGMDARQFQEGLEEGLAE